MNRVKFIIDIKDDEGKRIVFTYKKWKEKAIMHPELRNKTFLKNLKETIANPEEVWQDYGDPQHKRCYYKKYSVDSYVKAVVWIDRNPCQIITAFQTNYIKEEGYFNLQIK